MSIAVECIGWAGAVSVVGAYGLLSMRKLSSDHYAYHAMNILGSFLLALYAIFKDAGASLAVNAIWMMIGIGAVASIYRSREPKDKQC